MNVPVFLAAAGQFAAFCFVSLSMQQVLGMSAEATGAAFPPFSLALIAATVVATRVTSARTPRATSGPAALAGGYAPGLAVAAALFVLAAAVAFTVLPRTRTTPPGPRPPAPARRRLEETPS